MHHIAFGFSANSVGSTLVYEHSFLVKSVDPMCTVTPQGTAAADCWVSVSKDDHWYTVHINCIAYKSQWRSNIFDLFLSGQNLWYLVTVTIPLCRHVSLTRLGMPGAGVGVACSPGSVSTVSHSQGCKGAGGGGDLPEECMQAG